jgi:hypothetical protein
MAVVARNDSAGPIQIKGGSNTTVMLPGEIKTLTENEWASVSWQNRGPGRLISLSPEENTSEILKTKFEYYQPGPTNEIRYIGYATQDADDTDPVWTVRRYNHEQVGAEFLLTEVQVFTGVAWSDRATLPWT